MVRLGFAAPDPRASTTCWWTRRRTIPKRALSLLSLYSSQRPCDASGRPMQRTCPGMDACEPANWGDCFGEPEAKVLSLSRCYRSTLPIARLCNAILRGRGALKALWPRGRHARGGPATASNRAENARGLPRGGLPLHRRHHPHARRGAEKLCEKLPNVYRFDGGEDDWQYEIGDTVVGCYRPDEGPGVRRGDRRLAGRGADRRRAAAASTPPARAPCTRPRCWPTRRCSKSWGSCCEVRRHHDRRRRVRPGGGRVARARGLAHRHPRSAARAWGASCSPPGNGRCNFTNINASAKDYFGDAALAASALAAFPPPKVLEFFSSLGIPARVDAEGRAYPASNMAASVLDALRLSFAEAGGEEVTGFRVRSLSRELVATGGGRPHRAGRCALLATGGPCRALAWGRRTRPLSRRSATASPAVSRRSRRWRAEPVPALKGLRAQCVLTMEGRRERGEILFTEYGVSGIAALQLFALRPPRRAAGGGLSLRRAPGPCRARPPAARAAHGGLLKRHRPPARGAGAGQKRRHIACQNGGGVDRGEIQALETALTAWTLPVRGARDLKQAQVTAGGLEGALFDPQTLASRRVPGLYAAGEILDVDGPLRGATTCNGRGPRRCSPPKR